MDAQKIREFRETLRKLERELDAQLKEGSECCGVSLVQCHTLLELDKRGMVNLKDLSTILELDKSTVSRGIDLLVKNGLVHRDVDEDNRRFVLLSLTEKGENTCCGINQLCDNYYIELFHHIPQEKHKQVIESLFLFAQALGEVKKKKTFSCQNSLCQSMSQPDNND